MEVKKITDKVDILEVNGQQDCFNDCEKVTWNGNRNSTDNGGSCKKHTSTNCSVTCDW